MSTRTVKARLALDGEKEYKNALSSLNSENRVLASEMKKLQAEYKGNSESTEFLTKKGELLEKQLEKQRDRVQTLREAVANAAEQYGENSEKTQAWVVKLNNAEAAELELQHAVEENNTELDNQGNVMSTLSGKVEEIAGSLGIQIPAGAQKALDGMKSMGNGTALALGATMAAVTALISAVKKLHEITLEAASQADDLITKSMTTGVSTKTLQQWQYASNLIDVSVDTMTGSLTKLTRNMAEAAGGNESLSAAFESLGVSITNQDGTLRSAEEVFYELIDALGQVDNQTQRDALTMEILGKSAQDLNPLILQGSEALQSLAADAEAAGYVLDDSQIKKLGEVDDAYQKMQLQIEATKKELAVQFAPASKAAMELFTSVVKQAGRALKSTGIIEGFSAIVESLANIITHGDKLSDDTIPKMGNKFNLLQASLGAVAQFMAVIADAANLITSIVTLDWNGVKTAVGWNYRNGDPSNRQRVHMQQNGTWEQYATYYGYGDRYGYDTNTNRYFDKETGWYIDGTPSFNAAGTDNWRGGLTWVGEAGPELLALPRGSRILSNQESRQLGGDVFYITIDAKNVREFNDIVEMAQSARVRRRMGG